MFAEIGKKNSVEVQRAKSVCLELAEALFGAGLFKHACLDVGGAIDDNVDAAVNGQDFVDGGLDFREWLVVIKIDGFDVGIGRL